MTEFTLSRDCILGLMPEKGIKRLLGETITDPHQASGIPRCELYLRVHNPEEYYSRGIMNGAKELSPITHREWGDRVGYLMDPDGHVIAFATAEQLQNCTNNLETNDHTQRFSDRVDNYVKFRPRYPQKVVEFMSSELGLKKASVIVDVGSGTGISSELFLSHGNMVYGVEPNEKMRNAADHLLAKYPNFKSVKGTAEATGLEDGIADFIIAAQAFHWFDTKVAKQEFKRILKANGYIILMWNDRKITGSGFAEDYEGLIEEYSIDYHILKHKNIEHNQLEDFLGIYQEKHFYNEQCLDFAGLLGRLISSSYAPNDSHPRYADMCQALNALFDKYQKNGFVTIEYDTQIFYTNHI